MKLHKLFVIVLFLNLFAFSNVAAFDLPPMTQYTENFDTLLNSGTGSTMPADWYFSETGSNSNTTYTANDGSTLSGNTYSYGTGASTDRALGELTSNSVVSTLGASFTNKTGGTIGRLVISYVCEQWRSGDTTDVADILNFQYSTDATSLTTGTWTDWNGLDCTSSVTTLAAGALDGNNSSYRKSVSDTITGLNIANDATFWLRWTSTNISGSDDGLAIDDFVMDEQDSSAVTLSRLAAQPTGALPLAFGLLALGALVVVRRKR